MQNLLLESERREAGIYIIRNNDDTQVYVGSTNSLISRYGSHKSDLDRGAHLNKSLQALYGTYGANSFSFSALQLLNLQSQNLRQLEQAWINHFLSLGNPLLNTELTSFAKPLAPGDVDYTQVTIKTTPKAKSLIRLVSALSGEKQYELLERLLEAERLRLLKP